MVLICLSVSHMFVTFSRSLLTPVRVCIPFYYVLKIKLQGYSGRMSTVILMTSYRKHRRFYFPAVVVVHLLEGGLSRLYRITYPMRCNFILMCNN